MSEPWLTIVGIGEDGIDGLSAIARGAVEKAEILVGGERHLAMIDDGAQTKLQWASPLQDTIDDLGQYRGQRVCVLATGDPMWFGIGVTLQRTYAPEDMRIIPAPSAFALAAARLGWPVTEAICMTVHGRRMERIRALLSPGAKLIVLSLDGDTPRDAAVMLSKLGYGQSKLTALSHMGGDRESRIDNTADDWGEARAADLNTLAIDCVADAAATLRSRLPGLPDDAFAHDGQLTKREVRAVTLAALTPGPGQLLWDVGAGCGSIAIEWMRAAAYCRAIAIERNAARVTMIEENSLALGAPGLKKIEASAPDALAGLEQPDAIFIGGGLGADGVVTTCWEALKPGGILVANGVTFEGEQKLIEAQKSHGGELVRLEISRAENTGEFLSWKPMKPVSQWRARKT